MIFAVWFAPSVSKNLYAVYAASGGAVGALYFQLTKGVGTVVSRRDDCSGIGVIDPLSHIIGAGVEAVEGLGCFAIASVGGSVGLLGWIPDFAY